MLLHITDNLPIACRPIYHNYLAQVQTFNTGEMLRSTSTFYISFELIQYLLNWPLLITCSGNYCFF